MPILLINMLIAMMASTFDKIIIKSEKDWIHQWAKIVIMLEQTFSNEDLLKFQQKYSVKIENPLDIHKGLYREYTIFILLQYSMETFASHKLIAYLILYINCEFKF